jgi:hypothetical protein
MCHTHLLSDSHTNVATCNRISFQFEQLPNPTRLEFWVLLDGA